MIGRPDPLGWFARQSHPRLAALVLLGGAVGFVGALLIFAGVGSGTLGLRLAVLGALAFFFGASGYVAFAVFEREFE